MSDTSVEVEDVGGGEFERTPVHASRLKGWKSFLGMYAGEHAAGTEFMIGPLFLAAGASLKDLIFGLLIGNILAILTWRYIVAPIAVSSKLTLYYQLEKIAGKHLVKVYNVVNGVLFCFLAGAMITVSASAVGIPFGVSFSVPEDIFGLSSPAFSIIVIIVGLVMAIVFAACGLSALTQMEVDSWESLLTEWDKGISVVQSVNGSLDFGFWKIVIFSWLCNAAMHLGMADLSIMRFAKDARAGWGPSIGMFLGHYMAWICASFMLAAQIKLTGDISANPGALAWSAVGWTGIICVIIAGWTTANPTIYRAGLAFQSLFSSNAKSYSGVILAGVIATAAGIFPTLSSKLLDFVGLYGTILGPMGGVIFVNHYLAKKMNFTQDYANEKGASFNTAVLLAWVIPVALGLYFIFAKDVFAAYAVIPCWIASSLLYVLIMKLQKS
jgi:NCS1 family nucleobase:cation symporter-1